MMYRIRYDGELSHSKSKYEGGFYKVGSKAMNTAAYNHDYYIKNKEKWAKNKESSIGKAATKEPERKDHTIKFQNGMEIPDWIVRLSTLYVIDIVDYLAAHKPKEPRRWREPEQNYSELITKYNDAKAKKIVKEHESTSFFDTNGFFDFSGFFSKNKKKERKKSKKPIVIKHSAVAQTSGGGRSKSKYVGGFEFKGNRMNNTKAYNHDYYIKNKEKWAKSKQGKDAALGSLFFIPTTLFNSLFNLSVATISAGFRLVNDLLISVRNTTEDKPDIVENKKAKMFPAEKNSTHKYLYKVTKPDGSVRYFYSSAEYNAYLSNLNIKTSKTSIWSDIQAVNPGYQNRKTIANNDENCGYCALAYDLRRRGYDVTAISEDDPNFGEVYPETIQSWYENGDKAYKHHRAEVKNNVVNVNAETKKLYSELESQGDGASGFINVHWRIGGAHAMAYQVIDGRAFVIDAQSSTMYDENAFTKSIAPHCVWAHNHTSSWDDILVSYMRTDNLKPTKRVSTLVKNRDETSNNFNNYIDYGDKVELIEEDEVPKRNGGASL